MCFILTVTGEVAKPLDFADDDTLKVNFVTKGRPTKGNDQHVAISEGNISKTGGCACSLLSDSADWDGPVWALRPEGLPFLSRTIEKLRPLFGADFTFQAHWIGEKARRELSITVDDFLNVINENSIANFTLYRLKS